MGNCKKMDECTKKTIELHRSFILKFSKDILNDFEVWVKKVYDIYDISIDLAKYFQNNPSESDSCFASYVEKANFIKEETFILNKEFESWNSKVVEIVVNLIDSTVLSNLEGFYIDINQKNVLYKFSNFRLGSRKCLCDLPMIECDYIQRGLNIIWGKGIKKFSIKQDVIENIDGEILLNHFICGEDFVKATDSEVLDFKRQCQDSVVDFFNKGDVKDV